MKVFCPECRTQIGSAAPQGGLRIKGLAITLVKADGTVSGPCKRCRAEVVLSEGGELSKSIKSAMAEKAPRSRRLVFVIEPEKLTRDREPE